MFSNLKHNPFIQTINLKQKWAIIVINEIDKYVIVGHH
jgi:hypothetical protein